MAKTLNFRIICCGLFILFSTFTVSQVLIKETASKLTEAELRAKWLNECIRYTNIRERGMNKHDSIQKINKWVKSTAYAPYCGAGLAYTAHNIGINFPITYPAAVRNWFTDKSKIIYAVREHEYRGNAQSMDVVWLFQSHIEAIAQSKLRRDMEPDDKFMTIGFNTSGSSTGQQGVYYPIWRRWRDVKKIANHVTPYYNSKKK